MQMSFRQFSSGKRSYVTSCRAVILERFGGPEVLELRSDVSVPDLKPREVLVHTRAASINPLDLRVNMFFLDFECFRLFIDPTNCLSR